MADTTLFGRLRRLFSTNVIVRNVGGKKLRVSDTSGTQAYKKSNLIDRYQKIFTGAGLSGYSDALMTKSMRLNLFKDYESMDSDAIISSALDIYADESTMKSEYGDVLEINLTTIKVQNFDLTITTIPTYAFISDSFTNWRGMSNSNGRRIKRAISVKIDTIRFCDETMLEQFQKIEQIQEFMFEGIKPLTMEEYLK